MRIGVVCEGPTDVHAIVNSWARRWRRSAATTESCWHLSNAKPGRADHSATPEARRFSMRWTALEPPVAKRGRSPRHVRVTR